MKPPEPDLPDPGVPERRDWSGVVFVIAIGLAVLVVLVAAWTGSP